RGNRPVTVAGIIVLMGNGQELHPDSPAFAPVQTEWRAIEQGCRTQVQPGQIAAAPAQRLVVPGQIQEFESGGAENAPEIRPQFFRVREGIEKVSTEKHEGDPLPAGDCEQFFQYGKAVVLVRLGQVQVGGVENAQHGFSGNARPRASARAYRREYSKPPRGGFACSPRPKRLRPLRAAIASGWDGATGSRRIP